MSDPAEAALLGELRDLARDWPAPTATAEGDAEAREGGAGLRLLTI
jgi:hypothetical protein